MAYELCLVTAGKQVPAGPDWIHEVKHPGERLRAAALQDRDRLDQALPLDRRGRAEEPAEAFRDGEAVVLGVPDFNALHSRKHEDEVQLYAFDVLAVAGDDLRHLPLNLRQTNLERLLAGRPEGITVAPFERGAIGPDLYRAACRMGLEGLVSKHRDRHYNGGRQKDWIKVKNRSHPALQREL